MEIRGKVIEQIRVVVTARLGVQCSRTTWSVGVS